MDRFRKLYPKQKELNDYAMHSDTNGCRGVLTKGSVRGGKTFAACYTLLAFLQKFHRNAEKKGWKAFIISSTIKKAQGQIVPEILCILDMFDVPYEYNSAFHKGGPWIDVFGIKICLYAGADANSLETIQGETFCGGIVDELTNLHEPTINMLITRLNPEPNFTIFTYNAAPERWHWVVTEFMPRAKRIGFIEMFFELQDAEALSDRYKEDIVSFLGEGSSEYRRLILGEWIPAQGLVFNFVSNVTDEDYKNPNHFVLSIDHGSKNPTVGLLFVGKKKDSYTVQSEYFYDQHKNNGVRKTCGEYIKDMDEMFGFKNLDAIIIDSKAYDMHTELSAYLKKAGMQKHGKLVRANNNPNTLEKGIQHTQNCLDLGLIKLHERCTNLLRQLSGYSWKKTDIKEVPIDIQNDGPDALRYGAMRLFLQSRPILDR